MSNAHVSDDFYTLIDDLTESGLKTLLKTLEEEREGLDARIAIVQTALKGIDDLINS